jgi:hypothetical protein
VAERYPPLPRAGAIGYASVVDVQAYAPWLKIGPHLPGVRDVALWTTDQMRAYVDADRAARAAGMPEVEAPSSEPKCVARATERIPGELSAIWCDRCGEGTIAGGPCRARNAGMPGTVAPAEEAAFQRGKRRGYAEGYFSAEVAARPVLQDALDMLRTERYGNTDPDKRERTIERVDRFIKDAPGVMGTEGQQ